MKSFGVFLKKEWKEYTRTWKWIVLLLAFLAAAILSPVIMYLIPKMFDMLGTSFDSESYAALFQPTMENSYVQLFGNQSQMGFIALLVIGALSVTSEKTKGTAVLTLTKGLSRTSFVLAKLTAHVIWYTVVYLVSYGIFLLATQLLFGTCVNGTALALMGLFYLYGLFLLCTAIMASCVAKKSLGAMGISFLVYVLMMLLSALPYINEYTPGLLTTYPASIIIGAASISDLLIPAIETVVLSVVFVILGIARFQKQEL